MAGPTWVFFDVDQTLWDFEAAQQRALGSTVAEFYLEARFDRPEVFDDVEPALGRLHSLGYRLGVITNGNGYRGQPVLHPYFSEAVLSSEVGVAKPDPAIYALAAARTGRPPSELVMVGDSLHHDVEAAQAVGWRAVWLDRAGTGTPSSGPTIGTLLELPACWRRWADPKTVDRRTGGEISVGASGAPGRRG